MFTKVFAIFAVFATLMIPINAQSPLEDLSPCTLACIVPAAQQNGCEPTNASCVCASAQFTADATQCLTAHCTAEDIAAALALQTEQCSGAGITATGSPTGINTVSFTLPASSTTGTASETTTPAGSSTAPGTPSSNSPARPSSTSTSTSRASSTSNTPSPSATDAGSGASAVTFSTSSALFVAVLTGIITF